MKFLLCFITLFGFNEISLADPNTPALSACPTADQCVSPALKTSLKIQYGRGIINEYKGQMDTVFRLDLFLVNILGDNSHGCTLFKDLMVYRDTSLILSWDGSITNPVFNLMGLPGHYKISCDWFSPSLVYRRYSWEFDLIYVPPPQNPDTTTIIQVVKKLNPDFLFYPNPATEVLFIENESDPIKTVEVFTTLGILYFSQTVNDSHLKLPLEGWPKGIYDMKVATVSEKVIIKKFVVQ